MGLLEKSIEVKVCKLALDEYNIPSVKLTPCGETGYPDRVFFIRGGKPLFIEFKKPTGGGVVSEKQKYIKKMLLNRGYQVYVIDNVRQGLAVIKEAIERSER